MVSDDVVGTSRPIPRDTLLLLLSQFFGSLPIGLLLVFFPLYLHDLGMKALTIGSIFTLAGIGSSLLLMVIGPLADRFGRRAFLLAGTAVPILGFAIFSWTTNTTWLVIASLLGGVGYSGGMGGGLVTATFHPMLVGSVATKMRTTVISWSESGWVLSVGGGALLAGVPTLLAHAHYMSQLSADRLLFLFCLGCSLLAVLCMFPVREQHQIDIDGKRSEGPVPALGEALPHILKVAVFFSLQGAGLGLVVQLLPLWFTLRYHTNAESIAPWFSAAQVVGLPFILLMPALARRIGLPRVILLVCVTSTAFMGAMPFMPVMGLAGILFVARSALVGMQWPAQQSFLQGTIHPRLRGTATSVAMGCWSVTNALLPSLAGYFLDRGQLYWPPMLGVGCYAAAAAWFWITLRSTPIPDEQAILATPPALLVEAIG